MARGSFSPRVCFVEASGQNAFFGELLGALRAAAARRGLEVETTVDHFPPLRPDLVCVFVPHEYAELTEPAAHPTPEQLRRTIALTTEQPGTPWFEHSAAWAGASASALDINPLSHTELLRRGVRARRLRLGYVEDWDAWSGDAAAERPVDVAFLGGSTPRREQALAACGRVFARRRTAIRLVENTAPHSSGATGFLEGPAKWAELARTKVLVNVHRDELGYFEWQRAVEAMTNGCVVVSEHAFGFEPLVPGKHFIGTSVESLPYVLDALLDDEERLKSIRSAAYDFLRSELPLEREIETLLQAVGEAGEARVSVKAPMATSRPLPKTFPLPPPEWASEAPPNTEARMLKRLALTQRELAQLAANERSRPSVPRVRCFGAMLKGPPRVSVVVSLYNYARHVEEALESVALSDYASLQLVVVDDSSTDDSALVAAKALRSYSWLPSKLVSLPCNRGLPAARNAGIKHAAGELVFILDADNAVYPHAFERLASALDHDPEAVFAYGILEQFDGRGSIGLMSWLDWDPARLAWGNYVDAAALIRRPALVEVGGYTTDPRLYGWEDFDLWCTFADRRLHGVRVPEIVARYRRSRTSMISLTNIDTSEAWSALLERHPSLLAAASVAGA